MAWIRADITNKFAHLDVENVMQIESILKRQLYDKEATANINLDFDEVYNNSIYTSYESILGLLKFMKLYNVSVDCILFTGHAGNGHRAPTRAIAKKLTEKTEKNVIIVDILSLFSSTVAKLNDKAWVTLSRSKLGQNIWNKVVRGEIDPEKTGFDIAPIFKILYSKKLKKLINKIAPKVVLSTYPYSNAILSKIAEDNPCIKFAGVVVTDIEMLGFAMSSYGDVSNLHYFVASKASWENGLKIYPYLKDSKGPVYIGTNPCFFDGEADSSNIVPDTVLFVPGSAEGLGMGIKVLPKLARFCKENNKKLICISGQGKPYNFAKKIHANYKSTMSLFKYVASSDLKKLISSCEVVIGKAGGNMSSEFVSKSGCKIFYASIKGQETDNAKYYSDLGIATNVGNDTKKLFNAIIEKPCTPSIYRAGIISKSAVDTIVDTVIPYLG